MKKFKNGIYVGAYFIKSLNPRLFNLIEDINDEIKDYLTNNNIKFSYPDDPFHISLIYSKSIPDRNITEKDITEGIATNKKMKFTFKDFKIFPYLKKKCIAIEWKSALAEKYNKRLISFGLEHTHKEYIPHTTIIIFDDFDNIKNLEEFLLKLKKKYINVSHYCDIYFKIEDLMDS